MPPAGSSPLLLASVTDGAEAARALAVGPDVLDAKDPARGTLGACREEVLGAIIAERDATRDGARRTPVSAALGDAADGEEACVTAAVRAAACGADYVKVGLRGVIDDEGAVRFLDRLAGRARRAAPAVRVVAATYAEGAACGAFPLERLPRICERAGLDGCLVDTARKDGRSLFDHRSLRSLAAFIDECRGRRLLCALAGSLGLKDVRCLLDLGPDLVGVRGALCEAGRGGRLDPRRLKEFWDALHAGIPAPAA